MTMIYKFYINYSLKSSPTFSTTKVCWHLICLPPSWQSQCSMHCVSNTKFVNSPSSLDDNLYTVDCLTAVTVNITMLTITSCIVMFNVSVTYCAMYIASHHFRNSCSSREPNAYLLLPSLLFIVTACPKLCSTTPTNWNAHNRIHLKLWHIYDININKKLSWCWEACTKQYHPEGGKESAIGWLLYRRIVCGGSSTVSAGHRVIQHCRCSVLLSDQKFLSPHEWQALLPIRISEQ